MASGQEAGSWKHQVSFRLNLCSSTCCIPSPMDTKPYKALWKLSCPTRVNIIIWVMIFRALNCSKSLQSKLPSHSLLPSICHMCLEDNEDCQHLCFVSSFSKKIWRKLLSLFNLQWVWCNDFKANVIQILVGPSLKSHPRLLWIDGVKVILLEIWFERNRAFFTSHSLGLLDMRLPTSELLHVLPFQIIY